MVETSTSQKNEPRPWWVRHLRREIQFVLDLVVLVAAFVLAYLLRFEFSLPADWVKYLMVQLPLVVLLQFAMLHIFGVYSFIWRYIGMAEITSFVQAALGSLVPILILRAGLPDGFRDWRVPLSVAIIDTVLAFGGLLGLRVLRRALYERYERGVVSARNGENGGGHRKKTLLVGAGQAGLMAVRELSRQPSGDLEILGFVDDDPEKSGSVIHGVKVLGTTAEIPDLVKAHGIEQVVLTMVKASRTALSGLVDVCQRIGVQVRIMPGLFEILEGRVNVSRFREVRIEDVLGREQVRLDEGELESFLSGRRVMVTGAGGSIGAELARQVARFAPERLVLVERAEPALFEIHRELTRLWPQMALEPVLADVLDEERMRSLLSHGKHSVILHAAAHKHVPLTEQNPGEALRNNVLGTQRLGELAGAAGVDRFVLISTDKAVCPTSVMGATKRVAELVVQDLDARYGTRFLAVRFGNVLGSAGSVIPIFQRQIEEGGPVTVTHPEMYRYFMTIPEAAQLVLLTAVMGKGGEIFVLDMGEPVKIVDLAKEMIRLAGYTPFDDIEIVYTGPRPGEKLREELELSEEKLDRTRHPKIHIGNLTPYPSGQMVQALGELERLSRDGSASQVRAYLGSLLPESRLHNGHDRLQALSEV